MKKIKQLPLIILIMMAALNLCAQITFEKTFGGDSLNIAEGVKQTTDGGYIITGCTASYGAGGFDAYLVKTDAIGDTLWTRTYGGPNDDIGYSVQQTSDGGYIIGGSTLSFGAGNGDAYLIKTNANGDTLWTRVFGGTGMDACYSVQQTDDGGYALAGFTESFGPGTSSIYLIKTDASGNLLWSKTFGGDLSQSVFDLQQTKDKGYVICGSTGSYNPPSWDMYVIKTDSAGSLVWANVYMAGWDADEARSIRQTGDGGFIVSGYSDNYNSALLIKIDSAGNPAWNQCFTVPDVELGYKVCIDNNNDYLMSGYSSVLSALFLIKINTSGDTLWTKTYPMQDDATSNWGYVLTSQEATTDGGCVIVAHGINYGTAGRLFYLIKTDSLGNSDCNGGSFSTQVIPNPLTGVIPYGTEVNVTSMEGSTATKVGNGGMVTTLCSHSLPAAAFKSSDTVICTNGCINFTDESRNYPTQWQWSFPGATMENSNAQNPPNICYDSAGNYTATLVVSNTSGSDTAALQIIVRPATPSFNLGNDTTYCGNFSRILSTGNANTVWSTGVTAPEITVTTAGIYWAAISGACGTASDTIHIYTQNHRPGNILGPDTTFCHSDTVILNATTQGATYLWQDSSTSPTFTVTQSGLYSVSVTLSGCTLTDSVFISSRPPVVITGNPAVICSGDSSQICAPAGFATYQWNNGGNNSCIYATLAGNYYVTLTDEHGCTAESSVFALVVHAVSSVSIIVDGDTLSSFDAVSYQWYLNGQAIPGATEDDYVARQSGEYTVQITDTNGCEAVSTPVSITGLADLQLQNDKLEIYPNPTNNIFVVETIATGSQQLELFDLTGNLLITQTIQNSKTTVDASGLAAGVYLVSMKGGEAASTQKLVIAK